MREQECKCGQRSRKEEESHLLAAKFSFCQNRFNQDINSKVSNMSSRVIKLKHKKRASCSRPLTASVSLTALVLVIDQLVLTNQTQAGRLFTYLSPPLSVCYCHMSVDWTPHHVNRYKGREACCRCNHGHSYY